jgi:hypothetical protein
MEENHRSSGSTTRQRLSNLGGKKAGQWKSRAVETQLTCTCPIPIQDGGKYSNTEIVNSAISRTTNVFKH